MSASLDTLCGDPQAPREPPRGSDCLSGAEARRSVPVRRSSGSRAAG
jgi:hypothetical protein